MFSKDDYQKVKIVATVGPSSDSVETLVEMAHAGADVLRLNLSHKKREEILLNVKNKR
jgi:pyruvate kinase